MDFSLNSLEGGGPSIVVYVRFRVQGLNSLKGVLGLYGGLIWGYEGGY